MFGTSPTLATLASASFAAINDHFQHPNQTQQTTKTSYHVFVSYL